VSRIAIPILASIAVGTGFLTTQHAMRPTNVAAMTARPPAASAPPTAKEVIQAKTRLLEAELQKKSEDSQSNRQAEQRVRERLNVRAITGAVASEVQCVSTVCRLTVTLENVDYRDDLLPALPSIVPWQFEGFYRAADDNENRVLVYFSREGTELPAVPTTRN
jgi:hypothetical protein